jgi:4-hydroxybenzoate polyprenyltransferase
VALALLGRDMKFGPWYEAGLVSAALLFLYQQWLMRRREPAACLRAFLNNNYVGMVIFIGLALQYLYRT